MAASLALTRRSFYRCLMPQVQNAPLIPGLQPGKKAVVVIFETDCPTCQLALPYLNSLVQDSIQVIGLSQDDERSTHEFVSQLKISYPVELDSGLKISRAYNLQNVPTFYLLDESGQVQQRLVGFDKKALNELASALGQPPIAPPDDGAPAWKPGCSSRHLEPDSVGVAGEDGAKMLRRSGDPASRITLRDDEDPIEYCRKQFGDALPVVPPTVEKVEAMVRASGVAPQS